MTSWHWDHPSHYALISSSIMCISGFFFFFRSCEADELKKRKKRDIFSEFLTCREFLSIRICNCFNSIFYFLWGMSLARAHACHLHRSIVLQNIPWKLFSWHEKLDFDSMIWITLQQPCYWLSIWNDAFTHVRHSFPST